MKDLRQNVNIVFKAVGLKDMEKGIDKVDAKTDDLGRSADKVGGKISRMWGAFRTSIAIAGLGIVAKKLFEIGTEAEETESKFRTTFGTATKEMQGFIDEFTLLSGTTTRAAQDVAAVFGAITRGAGATVDEAADLSKELVKLAGDIQSFYNIGFEEAVRKIRGGLTGEYEGLKALGIAMNTQDANLRALAATGKKTAEELTKLEQIQGRMALLFERSAVAVGDLNRTADSTQNTWRRIRGIWNRATEEVAGQMLPVFSDLISTLDEITGSAAGSGGAIQKLVNFIGGLARVVREAMLGWRALGAMVRWVAVRFQNFAQGTATKIQAFFIDVQAAFAKANAWIFNMLSKIPDNAFTRSLGIDPEGFRVQADAMQAQYEALSKTADEMRERQENFAKTFSELADRDLQNTMRYVREYRQMLAGVETPKVRNAVAELNRINEALDKNKITAEEAVLWYGEFSNTLDEITRQYPQVEQAAGALREKLRELGREEADFDQRSQATKNRMANAKAYVEQLERAIRLEKELRGVDERTADILKEQADLREKIVALGQKLPDLEGETLQIALAQIEAFEERLAILDREGERWAEIAAEVKLLAEGAREFGEGFLENLGEGDAVTTLEAIIEKVNELVKLQEEQIPLKVLEGEDETELRNRLEATKSAAVGWLMDVAEAMRAAAPALGETISAMIGAAISDLNPAENPEVQRLISDFQKVVTEASAAFERTGDLKAFTDEVRGAFDAVKAGLEALRGILPDEMIDKAIIALENAKEAALGLASVMDQIGAYSKAIGDIVGSVRDLADEFGILTDSVDKALKGVQRLAGGFSQVMKAIDDIQRAESTLQFLMALPGAVQGLAQIGAAAGSLLGVETAEDKRLKREELKRQEELVKALKDNAYQVSKAVNELVRQAQLSGDRTGRELDMWIEAIQKYQQDIGLIQTVLQTYLDTIPNIARFAETRRLTTEAAERQQVERFVSFLEEGIRQGFIDPDTLEYFNNLVKQGAEEFDAMNQTLQDLDLERLMATWESAINVWADNIAGAFERAGFLIRFGAEEAADAYRAAFADIVAGVEDLSPQMEAFLQRILSATTPEEVEQALADFASMLAEEGTNITEVMQGLRWEDLQMLIDGAASFGDALRKEAEELEDVDLTALERAAEELTWALRFGTKTTAQAFRDFFASIRDMGLDTTRKFGESFPQRIDQILGTLDPEKIREIVSDWAAEIAAMGDQELMDIFGLTREELERILQQGLAFATSLESSADGFGNAVDEVAEKMREALDNLSLFTRYLSEDATEALRFFIDQLENSDIEFGDSLSALLDEARALDLSTPQGRQRLKEIMRTIAQGLLPGGQFEDLAEGLGNRLLGGLDSIFNMIEDATGGGEDEFSRSVQIARTITEIQANEMVAILNEIAITLDKIHAAQIGAGGFTLTPGELGFIPERMTRDDLMFDALTTNNFDVDVTVSGGTIDEMMNAIERELRAKLTYQGYARR